jgi:serine/threonine protein kinase
MHKTPTYTSLSGVIYTKVETIGRGAFGKVYKAKSDSGPIYVAVKTVRNAEISDNGIEQSSLIEIATMKSLNHPNVMPLIDYILTEGYTSYVMPLGVSLASEFKYKTITDFFDIITQLLKGLLYIHQNFVIHCDLKLDNITRCDDLYKISDFGVSKRLTSLKLLPRSISCAHLSVPECVFTDPMYEGQSFYKDYVVVSHKWDIWCLGLVLYNLSNTRRHTYRYELGIYETSLKYETIEQIQQNMDTKIERSSNEEWVKTFLSNTLQIDPRKRKNARDLIKLLESH